MLSTVESTMFIYVCMLSTEDSTMLIMLFTVDSTMLLNVRMLSTVDGTMLMYVCYLL